MQSDNRNPGTNRGNEQEATAEKLHDNSKYNNEINTGSVGFEGDGDNGASTLRVLRKKHENDTGDSAQKPQIP